MIVTRLMWSSLDLFSKYYAHFWPNPFDWNPSKKEFVANPKSTKWIFYFLSMATLWSVPVAHLILLTSYVFGFSNPSFLEILVNLNILLFVTVALVSELSLATYGNELELCSNQLIRLEATVYSRKFTCGTVNA